MYGTGMAPLVFQLITGTYIVRRKRKNRKTWLILLEFFFLSPWFWLTRDKIRNCFLPPFLFTTCYFFLLSRKYLFISFLFSEKKQRTCFSFFFFVVFNVQFFVMWSPPFLPNTEPVKKRCSLKYGSRKKGKVPNFIEHLFRREPGTRGLPGLLQHEPVRGSWSQVNTWHSYCFAFPYKYYFIPKYGSRVTGRVVWIRTVPYSDGKLERRI
jgi:hypothetical protein